MDKTYARFVVTVSASVEDINAMSESVERLTQVLVDQISDTCTAYNGKVVRVKFSELTEYDYSQSAEQRNDAETGTCPACSGVGSYFVGVYRETCSECEGTGHV